MWIEKTDKSFNLLVHEKYTTRELTRLLQESSAVGNYDDSYDNPGSSFLRIGKDHHLNREEVRELIGYLQHWLDYKCLS